MRAGLGVQVWTVDTEADARRLLDWGVDAFDQPIGPDICSRPIVGSLAERALRVASV